MKHPIHLLAVVVLVLGCVACGQHEKQQKILAEQSAAEAEKIRIQKETALVQDLISKHKDFDVCQIQAFQFMTNCSRSPGVRCPVPMTNQQYALLLAAGDVRPTNEPNEIFLTDKGAKAVGNEIEQELLAEQAGYRVLTGVSARLNILVTGEAPGPTKLVKARQQGVKILTEAEFLALGANPLG